MATKALLVDLQSAIADYLDNHKNFSIQSISNRAQVSYSTIRRILQNEAKDVRDETILSLIQVVMSRPDRISFLNKHYPSLGSLIVENREEHLDSDYEKLRRYRYKDPHNFILKTALTEHGTSRARVSRILGERGVAALDEMIEDRFLEEDNSGRISHQIGSGTIMNAEDILYQIKKDTDYFDKSSVGTNRSRLAHMSASISLEAYQELMTIVNEFVRKAENLKESKSNTGSIPVFIDLMVNSYDKESFEES